MLARTAFDAGDLAGAQRHALLMPASPVRDEMLARVAQARGERQLALEYFLVAPDADAVEQDVRSIARTDPAAAYDLEERFKNRLEALTTHPDAVAEAYWTLGQLATLQADRTPRARFVLLGESLRNYRKAVNLAPLSEKYLLAAGSEAFLMHDWATARKYYERDIDVNPTSPDAYAGLARVDRAQH
jgi:tetratricopeptide (TPR) repeat protein